MKADHKEALMYLGLAIISVLVLLGCMSYIQYDLRTPDPNLYEKGGLSNGLAHIIINLVVFVLLIGSVISAGICVVAFARSLMEGFGEGLSTLALGIVLMTVAIAITHNGYLDWEEGGFMGLWGFIQWLIALGLSFGSYASFKEYSAGLQDRSKSNIQYYKNELDRTLDNIKKHSTDGNDTKEPNE